MRIKFPKFKTKNIRDDIWEMVELAPIREMYGIVLDSIDQTMKGLVLLREEIPENKATRSLLKKYDKQFTAFGEREARYYNEFVYAEGRSEVDEPLFKGDYSDYDFVDPPSWPDIETPWRLANMLSRASAAAGMDQDSLNELAVVFNVEIRQFWLKADELIGEEIQWFESALEAEDQEDSESTGNGRVYGVWSAIAGWLGRTTIVKTGKKAIVWTINKLASAGLLVGTVLAVDAAAPDFFPDDDDINRYLEMASEAAVKTAKFSAKVLVIGAAAYVMVKRASR